MLVAHAPAGCESALMAARSIDLICCDSERQNFTKPPRFLPNRAFDLGQHLIPRRVAGAGRFISESPHEAQASSAGLRRRLPVQLFWHSAKGASLFSISACIRVLD